jgi:hypothetical protein
MNDKIRLLKQQAGIDDNPDQEGLDLFAQLIILECDRYARSTWEHGHLLGGDLKRLFGLEGADD